MKKNYLDVLKIRVKHFGVLCRFIYRKSRHVVNKTIIVIGDSHVNFFGKREEICWHPLCMEERINICPAKGNIDAIHVGPGLAYNLNIDNCTNRTKEKIEWLDKYYIKKDDIIVFSFGEIDIRAHLFLEAERQNIDWEKICENIVFNYIQMLRHYVMMDKAKIFVWAPVASKPIKNEKSEIDAIGDERSRNIATEYFIKILGEECAKIGVSVLTIFNNLIDENYKTKTEYYSDEIHLSKRAFALAKNEFAKYGIFI